MAWLAADKSGSEFIFEDEPFRDELYWNCITAIYVYLPKGSIKKLIGKSLTWEDEPIEIK